MFPDIAFSCEWCAEDGFFDRYYPSASMAVARSESGRDGEYTITTLYLTQAEYPEFFLETQTTETPESGYPNPSPTIEPMTPERAHLWMLAPEVTLLALLYPELPKTETETVGVASASPSASKMTIAEKPDTHHYSDGDLATGSGSAKA
jgi:hypothetical protein